MLADQSVRGALYRWWRLHKQTIGVMMTTGRPRQLTPMQYKEACRLRAEGWEVQAIAAEFHVSRRTLSNYTRRERKAGNPHVWANEELCKRFAEKDEQIARLKREVAHLKRRGHLDAIFALEKGVWRGSRGVTPAAPPSTPDPSTD